MICCFLQEGTAQITFLNNRNILHNPKDRSAFTHSRAISIQTCVIVFCRGNTKGTFLKNSVAALFHTTKVNWDRSGQAPKSHESTLNYNKKFVHKFVYK